MKRPVSVIVFLAVVASLGFVDGRIRAQARKPTSAPRRPAAARPVKPDAPTFSAEALQVQVLLDRVGFSAGEIDGTLGTNTHKAMAAFASARGLSPTMSPTEVLDVLGAAKTPSVVQYTLTPDDLAGPFTDSIPSDLMAQSKLPALNYTSPAEALAERFHTSPAVLKRLNPGLELTAGAQMQVPNVEPFRLPARSEETASRGSEPAEPQTPTVTVTVSKSLAAMTVTDASGAVLLYAPVTSGSEHDPLPLGTWSVTSVTRNPTFNYNPELFWDARADQAKARIPAGPNGPVGVVWIGLNKEHYGLHGTPEPGQIGHTASHGCVRLTNWDATRLAALVQKGTAVVFVE